MNDFSEKMLHSFGRRNLMPNAPAWVIKLLFGELSEILLRGSRVSNEKIKRMGFGFWYQSIHQCL
jgi:NAD dependent epimerase/dehydratase family enzyme